MLYMSMNTECYKKVSSRLIVSKFWSPGQEESSERAKEIMSPVTACELCGELLAPSLAGRANHMKKMHGVVSQGGYRPMDPQVKESAIKKVEGRLEAFLIKTDEVVASVPVKHLPALFPTHTKMFTCNDCGPTDSEGVTRYDGCFLCFACLEKRASV